jgi:hypothetical protein
MAASQEPNALLAPADTVAQRLSAIELSAAGREVVAAAQSDLLAAVESLAKVGLIDDAVALLGQAVVSRAGVWWACLTARREPLSGDHAGPETDQERLALEAAEAWVQGGGADRAAQARESAEAAGLATPAGAAAMAAFFAADNLAPAAAQPVPPPPHIAGLFSSTAVLLAAVRRNPVIGDELKKQFVDFGLAIAGGRHPWMDNSMDGQGNRR